MLAFPPERVLTLRFGAGEIETLILRGLSLERRQGNPNVLTDDDHLGLQDLLRAKSATA